MFSICTAALLFCVNVGDIVTGVFARYFFAASPVWTEELARYCLIWMVMLAANPALKRSEHMAIDMVVRRLPGWGQTLSRWTTHVVFLGITLFMTWYGYFYAIKMSRFTTMGLGISKTIPLMAIPVGMALLFVQYLLMQFIPKEQAR